MNETEVGILLEKRLGRAAVSRLALQTLIPAGLNNLAYATVKDPDKRKDLVTDRDSVSTTIVASNSQYYANLSTLISTNGLMLDKLQFGTIYYFLTPQTFLFSNVNTTTNRITFVNNHDFAPGTRIWLTTTDTLPAPFTVETDYYVNYVSAKVISLCLTYADAIAGTNIIDITTQGAGTDTATPQDFEIVQWLGSPNQGSLTSCVPIEYVQGWLVNNRIYLKNATSGTLKFASPFIPTLATLPGILEQDLIDELVTLATSGGAAPLNPPPEGDG